MLGFSYKFLSIFLDLAGRPPPFPNSLSGVSGFLLHVSSVLDAVCTLWCHNLF